MTVYLLTTGDGSDGDEWGVLGIFTTREKAEAAKAAYRLPVRRGDGSQYSRSVNDVEEWPVDELPETFQWRPV
jgi:hypothetical protein